MCEVFGDDFYKLTWDRQNGESLASSTRKSRAFIDTLVPRTFHILEQDTGIDVRKLRNFFKTKEKIQEGKERFMIKIITLEPLNISILQASLKIAIFLPHDLLSCLNVQLISSRINVSGLRLIHLRVLVQIKNHYRY